MRSIRYQWLRLVRLRGDPLVIARGIAIGTFIGITPTIPFHTVLSLALCAFLRGHVIAAIVANWIVSNPVSIPIEYYLSWKIGSTLFGSSLGSWEEVQVLIQALRHSSVFDGARIITQKGLWFILSLTGGGVLLGIPFALASYYAYLKWYFHHQKRRYEKILQTRERRSM